MWETTALPPRGEASLLTLQLTPKRVPQGLMDGRAEQVARGDSELLKEIMGPRVGGIRVPLVGLMLGAVLELGELVVKPPGYLREGGGHQEQEVTEGFLVVIGVGAPLVLVELIQEVREWVEPAAVTAAVVGAAQLETPLPPLHLPQQPPL